MSDDSNSAAAPKVSVLMSVFNGEAYLREAIDSILGQTFGDFEFVIINDGSHDRSEEIIRSYNDPRIRFINNERNLRLIDSLNKGLVAARGEYLARHDADDVARPHRLEKQVAVLDARPNVVLVGGWLQLIDEHENELETWRYPEHPEHVRWAQLFDSAVGHPSMMARLQALRDVGGYCKDFPHAEDYELWSRLARLGDVVNLPERLVIYRVHSQSVSTTKKRQQIETRFRIASGNIGEYLNDVPDATLRILCDVHETLTQPQMLAAMRAYEALFDNFIKTRNVPSTVERGIRDDLRARIGLQLQSLGYLERLTCIARRRKLFGPGFWLTGRFLWYVLGEKWKRCLKRLVGGPRQA